MSVQNRCSVAQMLPPPPQTVYTHVFIWTLACSSRMLKPLTKEEWEKQQSVLHRVYDPETGRNR